MGVLLQVLVRPTHGDPYAVLMKRACIRFAMIHAQLLLTYGVVIGAMLALLAHFSSWWHAFGIFVLTTCMAYVVPALNACWMRFRAMRRQLRMVDGCRDMETYEYNLVRSVLTQWDIPRIRVSAQTGFVYKAEWCCIYVGFDCFALPRAHLAFYLLHETAHHHVGYINIWQHNILLLYGVVDDVVCACEKRGYVRLARLFFAISGMRLAQAEEYFADAYALYHMRDVSAACEALAYDFGDTSADVERVFATHPPLSLRIAHLKSVTRI